MDKQAANASYLKIESGIAIPPKSASKGSNGIAAAVRTMEIGQSFLDPGAADYRHRARISSALKAARRAGIDFTTRKVEGGVRVWRTA